MAVAEVQTWISQKAQNNGPKSQNRDCGQYRVHCFGHFGGPGMQDPYALKRGSYVAVLHAFPIFGVRGASNMSPALRFKQLDKLLTAILFATELNRSIRDGVNWILAGPIELQEPRLQDVARVPKKRKLLQPWQRVMAEKEKEKLVAFVCAASQSIAAVLAVRLNIQHSVVLSMHCST